MKVELDDEVMKWLEMEAKAAGVTAKTYIYNLLVKVVLDFEQMKAEQKSDARYQKWGEINE